MADRPSLLARLEAALTWPRWDDRPAGIVRSDATSGPIGNARHVSDGGAYTLLLRPPPPILDDPRPLAGMRVAVKDLVAVAGCPLRAGSAVRADAP
ncbi:MAG TPA: hypothetical protein VHF25_07840, partial [Nitriliruptorales bacterium]|nr:hypothetical protein [Nitriliruptorales bacterium]